MRHTVISILLLTGCLVLTNSVASTEDLFDFDKPLENKFTLHINGYAFHFSRADQNENTLGIGFSYLFGQVKSEATFLGDGLLAFETDIYKDSSSDVGYAVGVSWQKPLSESWIWGLKAGVVHQEQQTEDSDMYLIPYILPFVESHWHIPLNFRVTLVPPIGITYGLLAFQLIVNFN